MKKLIFCLKKENKYNENKVIKFQLETIAC